MAPAALPQFKRKARIFAAAEHHAFGTRSTLPHHLKELNAGNYSVALVEDLQERLADPFLYIAAVHTGIATVHTYAYFDALKNARNMRTVAEGYGGNACPKGSPRSSSPAAAENFVAPRRPVGYTRMQDYIPELGKPSLPAATRLSPQQAYALYDNLQSVVNKTLPGARKLIASGKPRATVLQSLQNQMNLQRWRFIDQVPGGRSMIDDILREFPELKFPY